MTGEVIDIIAASAVVVGILISTALLSRGSNTSLSTPVNAANNSVRHRSNGEAANQGPSNREANEVHARDFKQYITAEEASSASKGSESELSGIDEVILKLWSNGMSVKEIAKEVGLSTSTVYRKLRKLRTKH